MKINKDKSIGRILFIVEEAKRSFLFSDKFLQYIGYEYIEKRRNNAEFFKNRIEVRQK